MKRYYLLTFALLFGLAMFSCTKDEEVDATGVESGRYEGYKTWTEYETFQNAYSVDCLDNEMTFNIYSSVDWWVAFDESSYSTTNPTSSEEWASATTERGEGGYSTSTTIKVEPNNNVEERKTDLVAMWHRTDSYGNAVYIDGILSIEKAIITITQGGTSAIFSIEGLDVLDFDSGDSSYSAEVMRAGAVLSGLSISSNIDWIVEVYDDELTPSTTNDWVYFNSDDSQKLSLEGNGSDSFTINAETLLDGEPERSCYIKISQNGNWSGSEVDDAVMFKFTQTTFLPEVEVAFVDVASADLANGSVYQSITVGSSDIEADSFTLQAIEPSSNPVNVLFEQELSGDTFEIKDMEYANSYIGYVDWRVVMTINGTDITYDVIEDLYPVIDGATSATKYHSHFGSGAGVTGDPYVITATYQLANIAAAMGSEYQLGADLDFGGAEFTPLGLIVLESAPGGTASEALDYYEEDKTASFSGVFDGNNKTISNIALFGTDYYYVGLFSKLNGATIKDLTFDGLSLPGAYGAGALAGLAIGITTIENVTTTENCSAAVTTTWGTTSWCPVGGIVGIVGDYVTTSASITGATEVTITNCTNNYTTRTGGQYTGNGAGGILGAMTPGAKVTITNCSNTAAISANNHVGGMMGGFYPTESTTAGPSRLHLCFFADDVALFASSDCGPQRASRQFAAECEVIDESQYFQI